MSEVLKIYNKLYGVGQSFVYSFSTMKLQLEVELYSENTMWKRLTNLKQMFYIYLLEGDSEMLNNFVLLVDREMHVKIWNMPLCS